MGRSGAGFAIPLLVFGWRSLLWGVASLCLGAIALSLFWRVLPGEGWLKGLLAGSVLALIFGAVVSFIYHVDWIDLLKYLSALWIAAAWMGVVLTGARHK